MIPAKSKTDALLRIAAFCESFYSKELAKSVLTDADKRELARLVRQGHID